MKVIESGLAAALDPRAVDMVVVGAGGAGMATALFGALPLALGRPTCDWRKVAMDGLDSMGRVHRLLFSSGNAGAISAAVLAGLAVSVLPTSGLRPGMRVLTPAEGFPELPPCRIGLLRNLHPSPLAEALAGHIVSSLDNLSQGLSTAAE
mgnify:CR=1 FL=1